MFEKGQCRGGLMLTIIYSGLRCYFAALLRRWYHFALLLYIWVDVNIKLFSVRRTGAMHVLSMRCTGTLASKQQFNNFRFENVGTHIYNYYIYFLYAYILLLTSQHTSTTHSWNGVLLKFDY